MKKLFSILFCLCCYLISLAQVQEISKEDAFTVVRTTMANFTDGVRFAYTKGITFENFKSNLVGKSALPKAGEDMIVAAFNLIKNSTTREEILRSYDGKAIAGAMNYYSQKHEANAKSTAQDLFGGENNVKDNTLSKNAPSDCRWYQLWCHVQVFANWVVANWATIAQIIAVIVAL